MLVELLRQHFRFEIAQMKIRLRFYPSSIQIDDHGYTVGLIQDAPSLRDAFVLYDEVLVDEVCDPVYLELLEGLEVK